MTETTTAPDQVQTTTLTALPAVGTPFLQGIFAGVTTTKAGTHCAVVLLPDQPSGRLHWQAAMDWAKSVGAELPTRPVSALLFANLRDKFERAWYWTSEQHECDGAYAWGQNFTYGWQDGSHTSYEGRVRAVRLIPLTA